MLMQNLGAQPIMEEEEEEEYVQQKLDKNETDEEKKKRLEGNSNFDNFYLTMYFKLNKSITEKTW